MLSRCVARAQLTMRWLCRTSLVQVAIGTVWFLLICIVCWNTTSNPDADSHKRGNSDSDQIFPDELVQKFTAGLKKIKLREGSMTAYYSDINSIISLDVLFNKYQCALSFDANIKIAKTATDMTAVAIAADSAFHEVYSSRIKIISKLFDILKVSRQWSLYTKRDGALKKLLSSSYTPIKVMLNSCPKRELHAYPFVNTRSTSIRHLSTLTVFYLGNCIIPLEYYDEDSRDKSLIPYNCMMTEKETYLDLDDGQRQMLAQLRKYIFEKDNICRLSKTLFQYLELADDLASTVQSVGTQLEKAMADILPDNPGLAENRKDLFEEIDGRVAQLVWRYYSACTSNTFRTAVNTPTRQVIQNAEIVDLDIFDRHTSKYFMLATFDNGQKALGKVMHDNDMKGELGEGLKEIMAYYTDRAMGINRFPHTVVKRLYWSSIKVGPITITPEGNKKPIHYNLIPAALSYYNRYLVTDPKIPHTPFIDITFIGYMKNLRRPRPTMYQECKFSLLDKNDYSKMSALTRQGLRDITDVLVLDFITHNFDRKGDNVVRSELRVAAFDAGHGFKVVSASTDPRKGGLICERQLQRPPLLQHDVIVRSEIPSSCLPLPISRRSCSFNRATIDRLQSMDKNLVAQNVKNILDREASFYSSSEAMANYRVYEGITLRIQYLLNFVEDCYARFGDFIYI